MNNCFNNGDETRKAIALEVAKHPYCEIRDLVKLLYQCEFAGGHMLKNKDSCLPFLKEEAEGTEPKMRNCDAIGSSMARFYIEDVLYRKIPLEWMANAFIFTAENKKSSADSFLNRLSVLYDMSKEGKIPFSSRDTKAFLDEYKKNGCQPIHHSGIYREKYHPAYRVIFKKYEELLYVMERCAIEAKMNDRVIINIDGQCGSAKTTLGILLANALSCPLIHMDDFFLPLEKRTEKRLSEAGGNVNYEYFFERVIKPLKEGKDISYRPFSCSDMKFKDEIHIPQNRFLIVEGSYSSHPYFGPYSQIKVFSHIGEDEQRERIRKRNGEEFAQNFFKKWIPMEERYFDRFSIRASSDIIIEQK